MSPGLRRVGLSATISDPDAYRGWLAPGGDADLVELVTGDPGAEPDLSILIPENRIPWSGHSGRHAAREVMELIAKHKTTLVFCNTRSLAELIFQDLWAVNDDALPIGIHHGSLALEARRKVEAAMAAGKLRGLVATASLDLGIDWGDIDLVVQMGAPKGSSRLLQRIGRANHRLDEPSRGIVVPGNRFEYLEARAALDAIDDGELDPEAFRPGTLDVLAQHLLAAACSAPFDEKAMLAEVRSASPYAALSDEAFGEVLEFIATGGYSLKAYDRFRRLVREPDGTWRISKPTVAAQHRMNAGVIVEQPLLTVRFRGGRKLGTIEEGYASTLAPGDHFYFCGLSLEVEQFKDTDIIVHASAKPARIVTYGGQRMSMSTHLANRVRQMLADRHQWGRFPDDVSEWLEVQDRRSTIPEPEQLLVETFGHEGLHYMVAYSFEGWNAHQSLGMLITRRMETRGAQADGLRRQRLRPRLLRARADPRPAGPVLARHPRARVRRVGREQLSAQDRLSRSGGDRRAGRAPASRAPQDRPPGELFHRPHLRRASPLRARASAAARRVERRAGADDRARAAGAAGRPRGGDDGPRRGRPDHADGGAADGHRRARGAAARAPRPTKACWSRPRRWPTRRCECEQYAGCHARRSMRFSRPMRILVVPALALLLSGCAIGTVASTAVGIVTLPVKVASKTVDLATTSQAEADARRGRELRKEDERRGRDARLLADRCRAGRPLPKDDCARRQSPLGCAISSTPSSTGSCGALLSLALVPDDGEELYLTLHTDEPIVEWVERHVIPYLDAVPEQLACPRLQRPDAVHELWRYLHNDDDPLIVADWPEDIAQFCNLLITGQGELVDLRKLTFKVISLPGFSTAANSKVPHNALHDARSLRDHILSLE